MPSSCSTSAVGLVAWNAIAFAVDAIRAVGCSEAKAMAYFAGPVSKKCDPMRIHGENGVHQISN